MFVATTLKELLKSTKLSEEFFLHLDPFQLNYIEMCFKKSLDEQIGMMTEIEFENYQLFIRYKQEYQEDFYPEIKSNKKAA